MAAAPKTLKKKKKKPKNIKAHGKHWVVTFLQPRWYRPKPKLKISPTLWTLLATRFQARSFRFRAGAVEKWAFSHPWMKDGHLKMIVALNWKKFNKLPDNAGDPRHIVFTPWHRSKFEDVVAACKAQAGWKETS